jgi:hypothetical protein
MQETVEDLPETETQFISDMMQSVDCSRFLAPEYAPSAVWLGEEARNHR